MTRLIELPENLPVPEDDGACDHLTGRSVPALSLPATSGQQIDLSTHSGWLVIYCYPMTGRPDRALPEGWNEIPGARGCTPQACSFRDHYQELAALDVNVYGVSTQTTADQLEAKKRLHLPFELLSDHQLEFARALALPLFEADNMTMIKRLTLITFNGIIKKVFYPVFPPDSNAGQVIAWLRTNRK
jgi:peroxiredoxin